MSTPTTSLRISASAEPQASAHRAKQGRMPAFREEVESAATQFLSDARKQILGVQAEYVSRVSFLRRQLLKKQFVALEAEYRKRIRLVLWNKGQIEELQDSIRMLSRYGTRRNHRAWVDRSLEEAMRELERREADEQEMLEDVRDVGLDIIYLGNIHRQYG